MICKNNFNQEIKRRITPVNRCYYGFCRQLNRRDLSLARQILLNKSSNSMCSDAATMGAFERKVLQKIIALVRVDDNFHIRTNTELYDLLNDMDIVQHINLLLLS